MDRHDDLVEKDLDESMGGEFAGDAAAATAVAGTPLIADQNLHYGSVVRPERQGRGGADATAPTAAATAGGGLAGLPRPTAHGRTSATSAAVGSSSATWAHTPAGWGGDDAPDGPATSEREGPAGNGLGFGGARATVAAGDLSSHRDPMDADDLSPPHRGTTDADDPVETEMDAADSVEETGDWRTREHIRRDGRGGELVPVGEDESGPVYRDHTFASLAPRSERPKLLLKIGMEPDELILAEGQSLRRCVQKGWLLKYSDDARWIKGWKRRYFRVVVHTSVELLNAEAAGRGAQLPRMDEQVTAAWLLYYEDQLTGEPKETIDLYGRAADTPADARFQAFPEAFQVSHDRRRTYYLRPAPSEGEMATAAELMADRTRWVQTINAAVESIGRLFVERFRRAA